MAGDNYKVTSHSGHIRLKTTNTSETHVPHVNIDAVGTGALSLGKLEDSAHASGDAGIMTLAVRNDSLGTTLAGTDGDYSPIAVTSTGAVHTSVSAIVPGTGATSLGKAEDAAHVSGDTGVMMLGVQQTTQAALAGTTGDYAPPLLDGNGSLRTVNGGYLTTVQVSKTRPSDTTAYASGDTISESTSVATVWTFASCARFTGGSGIIAKATIADGAYVAATLQAELWLFNATVTADQDNAVFTPTDAELLTLQAVIPINIAYVGDATAGVGGNVQLTSGTVNMPFKCNADASLYGVLVARNAYVPVSAETFGVTLFIYQD